MKHLVYLKKALPFLLIGSTYLTGCVSTTQPWKTPWYEQPISYTPPSEIQTIPPPKVVGKMEKERYPIDLPTVLKLAGANHLEITLAREKVHEAYADTLLAKEQFFPALFGGLVKFARHEGETQETDGRFIDVDKQRTVLGGRISLKWELGDAIFNTLSARQRHESSLASLEAQTNLSVLEAVLAYFNLQEAHAHLEIAQQAVEISEKLVREIEIAVELGRGFRGDVLRAKAQLAHNRLTRTQAEEKLQMNLTHLVSVLHLDPKIQLYPAEPAIVPLKLVEETTLSDLIKQAISQRPEVEKSSALLKAYDFEKDAAIWGSLIPTIQANAMVGGFGPNASNLSGTEDYVFSLGWKIGPGGLFDIGRMKKTDARYRTQRIQLAKLRQRIAEEVRIAYEQSKSRVAQIEIAKQGLNDAEESLQLNLERQKLGVGLPLEVIQAENALTRARLSFISTMVNYNQAQYRLYTALGHLPVSSK